MSWTEADFLKEHDVDIEQKAIKAKPGTDAELFEKAIQLPPKIGP